MRIMSRVDGVKALQDPVVKQNQNFRVIYCFGHTAKEQDGWLPRNHLQLC